MSGLLSSSDAKLETGTKREDRDAASDGARFLGRKTRLQYSQTRE
jgi:hypothetical protein